MIGQLPRPDAGMEEFHALKVCWKAHHLMLAVYQMTTTLAPGSALTMGIG